MKKSTKDFSYSGTINDLLEISSIYNEKLIIEDNELRYVNSKVSAKERNWLNKLGIAKSSDYYTIEFDSNNGSEIVKKQIRMGKTIENTYIPQKEGYTFLGWYFLRQGNDSENPTYEEVEFSADTKIYENYFLYAKYSGEAVMMPCPEYTSAGFWEYKDKIKSISFIQGEIPDNLPTLSWNIRESRNSADIIAYLEADSDDKYNLTIISTQKIYANADTSRYFNDFSELETINFDNLDTSKVKTMHWMFNGCTKLKEINLKKFNTSNVTNMARMFSNCKKLESLDLSSFITNRVETMHGMFWNCVALTDLNLENFNTENTTTMQSMFDSCKSLTKLNLSSFNTSNVTTMKNMFCSCNALQKIELGSFNTSNVVTMENMFYDCTKLVSLNLSNFNTEHVITMESMFSNCESLTELNLNNFDTQNVTTMALMFNSCQSLQSLSIDNFNTSKVNTMESMFGYCKSLTNINVKNFDTMNVLTMKDMFRQCIKLTKLDISSFNTQNVTTMENMFRYCTNLKTIYIKPFDGKENKGWSVENLSSTETLFLGCSSLIGEAGTTYRENYTDKTYAHIDKLDNPGYMTEMK